MITPPIPTRPRTKDKCHQCVLVLRVLRDPGWMKPHRGFLSEQFVDTLGGVREALCCRSLTHEREALCAGIATEHYTVNSLIAIMHLKAFAKVVSKRRRNELVGFGWTGPKKVC